MQQLVTTTHQCPLEGCHFSMGNCTKDVLLAVLIPLLLEALSIGLFFGLIIWKRITVAKFLYNLRLPALREIPQLVIRKFRRSSSTPPPEVYVERTLQNPTYDIEERDTSDTKAKEPTELYAEIPPDNDISNLEEFENDQCVYDIPDPLSNDQLEPYATTDVSGEDMLQAYATTDVSGEDNIMFQAYATTDISGENMFQAYATTDLDVTGQDMLNAYAITDVAQIEGQCQAYAMTDVPEKGFCSGSQKVVSAEVHVDRSESKGRTSTAIEATIQRNADAMSRIKNSGIQLKPPITSRDGNNDRAKAKTAIIPSAKQQNEGNKAPSKASLRGKPATAMKPVLHPKPTGAKDKTGAEIAKRVKFEDEDRRRSKSYAGAPSEVVVQEEPTNKSGKKSSIKGKPKPLPKKKGLNLMRNRGSSDSGVEGYSKLDLKHQYASLEPHMKQETNGKDSMDTTITHDSYSHLKR